MTARSSRRAAEALASSRAAAMLTTLDLANSVVSTCALARHVGEESELGRALANTAEQLQGAADTMYAMSEAMAAMSPAAFRACLPAARWRRLLAHARTAEQAAEEPEPGCAVAAPAAPVPDDRPVFLIEDL